MDEPEILLKTEQLLKFRLAFAAVCLLLAIAIKIFSQDAPHLALVAEIIVCVIVYSSISLFLILPLLKTNKIAANVSNYVKFGTLNSILLASDICSLTALVHATRGIESDLYILYLLPILFSSFVFTRKGIYVTSLAVSWSYIGLLILENRHSLRLLIDSTNFNNPANNLTTMYVDYLWRRILLRSISLASVALIWGGFCNYMANVTQAAANKLRLQLEDNERLVSQLIHQEKMASLGRLVAGIAHELNNPINFVHGNLPYLKTYVEDMKKLITVCDNLPGQDKQELSALKAKLKYDFLITDLDNIIADIENGVGRVHQLIKNLRRFGRLDEPDLQEASINEGIQSTLKILGQYYGKDKIPVELEFAELPLISCYPGQLNQVWMNLLDNAAQAVESLESPEVKIKTELQGNQIMISIKDNGSGIKSELQGKVFEPFFTTKPVGKGTGLGLSICHGIIERHHGKIWFESGQGGGTVFKVTIPAQIKPT
jgi:signal transduction histidine kinase